GQREDPAVPGQQLAGLSAKLEMRRDPRVVTVFGTYVAAAGDTVRGGAVPLPTEPTPEGRAYAVGDDESLTSYGRGLAIAATEHDAGHTVTVAYDVDGAGVFHRARAGLDRAGANTVVEFVTSNGRAVVGKGASGPGQEEFLAEAVRPETAVRTVRSEEHTSELQSRFDLVCRLLL